MTNKAIQLSEFFCTGATGPGPRQHHHIGCNTSENSSALSSFALKFATVGAWHTNCQGVT